MNVILRTLLGMLLATTIAGCATSGKTASVQVGMTKSQVIDEIGTPDSVSAQGPVEVLSYYLCYSNCAALIMENRGRNWYYVRLVNGQVDAFGNNDAFGIKGDFDSSKVITRNDKITHDVTLHGQSDIYVELKKLQELKTAGIITQEEFDARKMKILAQ